MPRAPRGRAEDGAPVPSMLDLVRLSPRRIFPPGGADLYRHIALLTELSPGDEVLDVACGPGVPLEYWVREHEVLGSGVDADPEAVDRAQARAREEGLSDRIQVQHASHEDLPYRDDVFHLVVGEMGLTAHADPGRSIRELVRVTRPGGRVALVQLVWKAPVDPRRRQVLSEHLGARPLMLVELKRILRESGIRDLHTEDWSDEETAFRRQVTKPFPDFAELFSLPEKLGILRRAWRRWGWRGVKTAVKREREVHRLLTKERIIGLDLLVGTKRTAGEDAGRRAGHEPRGETVPLPLPEGPEPRGRGAAADGGADGGPDERSGQEPGDAEPDADGGASAPSEGGGRGGRPGEESTPRPAEEDAPDGGERAADERDRDGREGADGEGRGDAEERSDEHGETRGLPLFGGGSER